MKDDLDLDNEWTVQWFTCVIVCVVWTSIIQLHSISGTAPRYLSNLLQPYTPARQLQSSSDTQAFVSPRVNTKTFGERLFSYAGPSAWNS